MLRMLSCGLLAALLLSACSRPEPPEKERPPEPRAPQASGSAQGGEDSEQASPIDRARAVEDTLEEAQDRQQQAIEDSGG